MQHASEFRRNVACADDEWTLGLLGELEETVTGDGKIGAGEIGDRRPTAGGDQNMVCAQKRIADAYLAGRFKCRPATKDFDLGGIEVTKVDTVQAFDVGITSRFESAPVEFSCGQRKALVV